MCCIRGSPNRMRLRSVVVITSALHAEGRRIVTGRSQFFLLPQPLVVSLGHKRKAPIHSEAAKA